MADPFAIYEISRTRDYNPDTGASIVIVFAGLESKMDEVAAYYEQAGAGAPIGYGYKTTFHKTGAGIILTVRIPDDQLYTERWNLNTEIGSLPLFYSQEVKAYLDCVAIPPSIAVQALLDEQYITLRGLLEATKQAILIGTAPSVYVNTIYESTNTHFILPDGSTDPNVLTYTSKYKSVVVSLIEFGDYYEVKRPVLKRVRFMPVASTSRTSLVGTQILYTTAQLISAWSVPVDIVLQITSVDTGLPTARAGTLWSWKERQNESETVIGSGRFMECRDWVFGRWSTLSHAVYTPP